MLTTHISCGNRRRIATAGMRRNPCSTHSMASRRSSAVEGQICPEAGYKHPFPEAGYRHTSPEAGYRHPSPEAGYRHPSPEAGYRHPSPEAGYRHTSPEGGYRHPSPEAGFKHPSRRLATGSAAASGKVPSG
jgi:hypothetical protein